MLPLVIYQRNIYIESYPILICKKTAKEVLREMSITRTPTEQLIYSPFYRIARINDIQNTMAIDLIENEDNYTIIANVPGFTKDEIEIEANFEGVKITAKKENIKESEKDKSEVKVLHKERTYTELQRYIRLSKPIKASDSSVTLKNGVLTIVVPFADEAKSVKLSPKEM